MNGLRWGRIVVAAILVEAVLLVLEVPVIGMMDTPFVEGADPTGDYTPAFATISAAAFIAGLLGGWWVARPLSSGHALHGVMAGIVATLIYLGIASIPPNSVATVFAAYGAIWFTAANGLRILGCVVGAAARRSSR
jgi:hypothetical protein